MAERFKIVFHAVLKGAAPAVCDEDYDEEEGIPPPWPAEWAEQLNQAIAKKDQEALAELCKPHLAAKYFPHDNFEGYPELFAGAPDEIPADDVAATGMVGMQGGYPLFRCWNATFTLELPIEVLLRWTDHDDPNDVRWSDEGYDAWMEEIEFWGFQDGVRWSLWGIPYELDGMGEHGCEPDHENVVDQVWMHFVANGAE